MISKDNVQYIASLARIHLQKDELDNFATTLSSILDYIKKLEELNVEQVEPTSHVLPLKNVFREDQVVASLGQKKATAFAIAEHEGSFKVPQIIE